MMAHVSVLLILEWVIFVRKDDRRPRLPSRRLPFAHSWGGGGHAVAKSERQDTAFPLPEWFAWPRSPAVKAEGRSLD